MILTPLRSVKASGLQSSRIKPASMITAGSGFESTKPRRATIASGQRTGRGISHYGFSL